jgi:hypothetical protein
MESDDLDRSAFLVLLVAMLLMVMLLSRRGDADKAKG